MKNMVIKAAVVMAFNSLAGESEVKASRATGCFSAYALPVANQCLFALKALGIGKLKFTPTAKDEKIIIPKPGTVIGSTAPKYAHGAKPAAGYVVKLAGIINTEKLSTVVQVMPPTFIEKNFTEIGREGTQLNPFWLVKHTDDNKLINMKLTVETVEVGGISVSCPTFTNIKDIAVNDVLYVKCPK